MKNSIFFSKTYEEMQVAIAIKKANDYENGTTKWQFDKLRKRIIELESEREKMKGVTNERNRNNN